MSVSLSEFSEMAPTNLPNIKRKLPLSSHWAIAQEIIRRSGIRDGECLEINANNAFLGISLAQLTNMHVYLMENSATLIKQIAPHLKKNKMTNHVELIKGVPQQIPVADHQINLVIYRRSIFNWRNQTQVFGEIYRILAPGGVAYLGDNCWGGEEWFTMENKLREYAPQLSEQFNNEVRLRRLENISAKIIQAGIPSHETTCTTDGLRIIIRRPVTPTYSDERVNPLYDDNRQLFYN
ncbi:MAG TPA: hypothetical protein DDW65_00330 [Firmicutes bacterium]|jgi:ubiquinone/menaquinone biosynthesis C-methylase UbiE|nr:hypothetical protein [Bacillota bacterium]